MKKTINVLFGLFFMVSLFFFSSCVNKTPEGPVFIENIDYQCLVIKQITLNKESANNPKTIFLQRISSDKTDNYFWVKKDAGGYKTITINWNNSHKLSENFAYIILDTINLIAPPKTLNAETGEALFFHNGLVKAYLSPEKKFKATFDLKYKYNRWGTFLTRYDQGLMVKYNPINKTIEKASVLLEEKTKFDWVPLAILILFIVISVLIFNLAIIDNFHDSSWRLIESILFVAIFTGFYHFIDLIDNFGPITLNLILAGFLGILGLLIFKIKAAFKEKCLPGAILNALIGGLILLALTGQFMVFAISASLIILAFFIPKWLRIIYYNFFHEKVSKTWEKIKWFKK